MNSIREYVTGVVAATLLVAIFEIILPHGNMKKYGSVIIGITVTAIILMPVAKLMEMDINFTGFAQNAAYDTDEVYETMLEREFCNMAEQEIEEKSGGRVRAEVTATVSEDTRVDKVVIYGEPDSKTMLFITDELGVSRSRVEIR